MDNKIKELQKRVSMLEFFLALSFSTCITSLYSLIKLTTTGLNTKFLLQYFIIFSGITLFTIYNVLPTIKIIEKVGSGMKDVWSEFVKEFREKARLGKIKTVFSLLIGISAIIQFILLFIK